MKIASRVCTSIFFFKHGKISICFIHDENMFKTVIVLKKNSETEANLDTFQNKHILANRETLYPAV